MALTYIDLPLPSHGVTAVVAAEAAHCAGQQDLYWEMHDAIFEAQPDLQDVDTEDEDASKDALVELGESVDGLDMEPFEECVRSGVYRPIVGSLANQALQQGINVTPYLLVQVPNVHIEPVPGFLEYSEFQTILQDQYWRSLGTPIPTSTPSPTEIPEEASPVEGTGGNAGDAGGTSGDDGESDDGSAGGAEDDDTEGDG